MGPTSRLFDDPSDDPVLIAQARALGLLGEIAYYRGMAGATSALVPNPPMPIAEWAPRYAFIPTSKTTRGGPATLTPVQKGLARLLQQFGTEALVFLKCPRIGASTFAALLILYYACYEQSDSLLYERTDDKAQEFMKDKLMPILRASTHLKVLLRPDGKTGEQDTWDNRELMTGASIKARSITNTKNVKGVRGRFIVGEECGDDAWEPGKEGSKTNLVMRRGQEFGDGRVYLSGTPTVKGRCLVSAEFETSIKHVFRMDCPHCGRRQAFEAGTSAEPEVHRVRSSHTRLGRPGMRYVKSADGEIVDAWYECANAECPVSRIEDGQKNRMMEDTGAFELLDPAGKGQRGKIGAFIWSAYSEDPKSSWLYLCEAHDRAWIDGTEKDRLGFVTMWMGMPYEEAPPPEADTSHMEGNVVVLPDGIDLPADTIFVVASIDNQEGGENGMPRGEMAIEATLKGDRTFVARYPIIDKLEFVDDPRRRRRAEGRRSAPSGRPRRWHGPRRTDRAGAPGRPARPAGGRPMRNGKAVAFAFLIPLLGGCAARPATVVRTPLAERIPPSLTTCATRPDPGAADRQSDVAAFVVELDAAGEDCRGKVDAIRRIVAEDAGRAE